MVKILKSCCVVGCKNLNKCEGSGVEFIKFPEGKALKKRWTESIRDHLKNQDWEPSPGSVVCNVHFVSGLHSPHEWHPDYVPSVFRSLRTVKPKPKGRYLDEVEVVKKKPKTPAVKRLQSGGQRRSLATPTRLTKGKGNSSRRSTGSLQRTDIEDSTLMIVDVRTEREFPEEDDDVILSDDSSSQRSSRSNPTLVERSQVKKSKYKPKPKSKRMLEDESMSSGAEELSPFDHDTGRNKAKKSSVDSKFYGLPLKNLSVVLERTSAKTIKESSSGDCMIKEEPNSEQEEGDYFEYPIPDTFMQDECKKCTSLQHKLRRQESEHKKAIAVERKNTGGTCRRCPVLEHKLKRSEIEIDKMLEDKLNKCQKCITLEQKIKKLENTIRKHQGEIAKLQSKLSTIEITEETFKKYKQKVKQYTGFPDHETLMLVFDHIKNDLPEVNVKSLTPYQMFVIVLMRLKLNLPFWDLTYRFGTSPNVVQSFYPQYVKCLEGQLSHVVLWPKANLHYRLSVLAGNLKCNFAIIREKVEVDTLLKTDAGDMKEDDKTIRLCASVYHISQLVTSNHHQQLYKILNSKYETDRAALIAESASVPEGNDEVAPQINRKDIETEDQPMDVDDSDIFNEDLTKDITPIGLNSKESLELECKNLRKEIDHTTQKLSTQFRFYTGMRDYDVFNNMLSFLSKFVSHISEEKLVHFQQLHMVLMRLKLNLEVQDLAYLFNVDPDYVVYLTRQWVDTMALNMSPYIDWPAGIEDADSEKRLQGSVKLKYQILWAPNLASRNKITGRDRERIDMAKLLRACAALYNIDDIEVFNANNKDLQESQTADEKTIEQLEKECVDLRAKLHDFRKSTMTSICKFYREETFSQDDSMVEYYTGFPNYQVLKSVFDIILPVKPESKKILTPFQQFIIVLLRLKLNLATTDVGSRLGVSQSHTHKLMQDWLSLIHNRVSPYITWPDDEEDSKFFTEMLRKTYAHIKPSITSRNKEILSSDVSMFDIPMLVCGGLFNIGGVNFQPEDTDYEFDSFDEGW